MDTKLWNLIADGLLKVYPDEEVASALNAASGRELPDGKLYLVKSGRRKIDLAVALSMAAFQASQPQGVYFM